MVNIRDGFNKKHAFLIGAYKNPNYLKGLILSLNSPSSNIYVHINRYNFMEFKEIINFFKKHDNIHFYSAVKVKWGGSSLLDSVTYLVGKSLEDSENQYFHLMTGQDILIRPLNELFDFFLQNKGVNFLSFERLPGCEMDRYLLYHLYDVLNVRHNKLTYLCETAVVKLQKLFNVKRTPVCNEMYWGSGWWSLQRDALEYLFKIKNKYRKYIKNTFAPDEMIYQTILLNAENKFNVVNDNLRYMIWDGNSGPRTLGQNDYESIVNSNCFFARKVEPEISGDLIKLIEKYRNNKNNGLL